MFATLVFTTADVGAEPPDSTSAPAVKAVRKSPTKAMIRSLLVPGWGQFYNGKKFKGTFVAAAEIGSAVAFFVRRDQINHEAQLAGQPPKRNFFLLSTLGIVFYSVVDAFVDAHLDDFDWGQLTYHPDSRTVIFGLRRSF
jgi:hypothetical protein